MWIQAKKRKKGQIKASVVFAEKLPGFPLSRE
jgi:hypothetical protein